jgi:hypothetical protein
MIWKGKKKISPDADNSLQNRLTKNIANAILKVQTGWANWMQRQSEKLSKKAKMLFLVTTVLAMAAYCLALVTGSWKESYSEVNFKTELKIPLKNLPGTKATILPADASVIRIMDFKHYLDSLATTASGKLKLDSILRNRPGLLDSINQVEKYYSK